MGPAIGSGLFSKVLRSMERRDGDKNSLIHVKCSQSTKHVSLCKFGRKDPFGKYRSRS